MYSKAFRALMIQKMTDPEGPSPVSLAEEIGVSRSSLYRWVSEADTLKKSSVFFCVAEDCMMPSSSSGVIRCSLALSPSRPSAPKANVSRNWRRS
jgi:hypothetical protein